MDIDKFVEKQLALLEIEERAEVQKNLTFQEDHPTHYLKEKGLYLRRLRIYDFTIEYFGRVVVTFKAFNSDGPLPPHSLSSGDVVSISAIDKDGLAETKTSGIVKTVTETTVSVVCDKDCDSTDIDTGQKYNIVRILNEVTYKRMKKSLRELRSSRDTRRSMFANVLFGLLRPNCLDSSVHATLKFVNEELNDVQKEAVKFALLQQEVAVIHGPPGTGKTTTVVEIVMQTVSQNQNVLVCAPSNVAVDNLVEKLSMYRIKMIRLGHPARSLPGSQCHSLDAALSLSEGGQIIADMSKEVESLKKKRNKEKNAFEREMLRIKTNMLIDDMKERKQRHVSTVLMSADVILSTITSASSDGPIRHLPKEYFDLVIIDECPQAMEAACWIPLLLTRKCILSGDHYQLPPVILSEKAERDGLSVTLMERLIKLFGNDITRMLTIQYRMNEAIMKWPSDHMYEGKLQAHSSVATRLLKDISGVQDNENTNITLLLIDTAGCHLDEIEDDDSKGNEGEADIVAVHVNALVESGLNPLDIAVVAPYNLQVDLMKLRLSEKYPDLEIKSVDGFQGREKEAVVLSLVRSNDEGKIGFLSEDRRINVAITRARRHLTVICNSETVSNHDFLKQFIEYFHDNGEVRSAALPVYEREVGNFPRKCYLSKKKTDEKKVPLRKKHRDSHSSSRSSYNVVKSKDIFMYEGDDKQDLLSELKEKYSSIIFDFMEDRKDYMKFPSSLSGWERRVIHEIAEKYELIHVSHGEGSNRYIEIKKPLVDIPPDRNNRSHSFQSYRIPQSSGSESTGDSSVSSISSEKDTPEKYKVPKVPKPSQKAAKRRKQQPPEETADTDDFDELIAAAMKTDSTCAFNDCSKKSDYKHISMGGNSFTYKGISAMLRLCQFCRKSFCYTHALSEVHGCGDAAKAHARSTVRKEGKIYPGSGVPDKHLNPANRAHLQHKLNNKLSQLAKQRHAKQKK